MKSFYWVLIYENIEEYNPNKTWKILIVCDDIIVDLLSNKKLSPIVTELFITGKKLNFSLSFFFSFFFTHYSFAVPKNIRVN